MAIISWICFF